MKAFEINKIVGAVLATALIASVISIAGNILVPEGGKEGAEHPPATTAGAKPALVPGGGGKEKKAAAVKKTLAEKKPTEAPKQTAKKEVIPLTAGDATRGARLAAIKCKVCHSLKAGGRNKIGPNLYGIVGRARASHEGFRYSKAMKAKGGTWSPEEIDIFLANPSKFVKGTNMVIKIRKPDQRADIIAYLKTLK